MLQNIMDNPEQYAVCFAVGALTIAVLAIPFRFSAAKRPGGNTLSRSVRLALFVAVVFALTSVIVMPVAVWQLRKTGDEQIKKADTQLKKEKDEVQRWVVNTNTDSPEEVRSELKELADLRLKDRDWQSFTNVPEPELVREMVSKQELDDTLALAHSQALADRKAAIREADAESARREQRLRSQLGEKERLLAQRQAQNRFPTLASNIPTTIIPQTCYRPVTSVPVRAECCEPPVQRWESCIQSCDPCGQLSPVLTLPPQSRVLYSMPREYAYEVPPTTTYLPTGGWRSASVPSAPGVIYIPSQSFSAPILTGSW